MIFQTKKMNREELKECELSCDKTGVLFFAENRVFRGINSESENFARELLNSDFFKRAFEKELFVETKIASEKIDGFPLLLEHKNCNPLCLSYEWTPAKIKKMALRVLQLMILCEEHGYCLVDPHVNNVVQSFSCFTYIDFGSLQKSTDSKMKEKSKSMFIRNFYLPLVLIERGQFELSRSLFLRRVELSDKDDYCLRTFFRPVFLSEWVSKIFRFWNKAKIADARDWEAKGLPIILSRFLRIILPKHNYLKVLNGLKGVIEQLSCQYESKWANYQHTANPQDLARFDLYIEIAGEIGPFESIVDLACNEGALSKKMIEKKLCKRAFAIDTDVAALESLDRDQNNDILTFLSDVMRPDGRQYDSHIRDRVQSDCVFALALTHHLYLSQGFSWKAIVDAITSYTKKYIFIEFMPLGLFDGTKSSSNDLPVDYSEKAFKKNLTTTCSIIKKVVVSDNRTLFVAVLKEKEV